MSQSQDKRFRKYVLRANTLNLIKTMEAAKHMEWGVRLKYAYCILFKRPFAPWEKRMKSYVLKRYKKFFKKPVTKTLKEIRNDKKRSNSSAKS